MLPQASGRNPKGGLEQPSSTRNLSTREQIILLEGSKLHGCLFPPWKEPEEIEFKAESDRSLFIDNTDFKLSDHQLNVFESWRRPEQVLPPSISGQQNLNRENSSAMVAANPVDLAQDITSDCSVVASLCALSAGARFVEIISSIFHPYDHFLSMPAKSENGKYIFKLQFNGCWRKVTIDDRLPSSRPPHVLHVFDRNNPGLLWPALIEKAYLKVRGGLDPRAAVSSKVTAKNPSKAKLPDESHVSDEIERATLWRRILKAFGHGDVLITLGTGRMSPTEEQDSGLAGQHDFAVMDLKETEMVLVKNPWSEGGTWKSPIAARVLSSSDDENDNHKIEQRGGVVVKEPTKPKPGSDELSPGTFWMSVNNVFQNFESMYINWNPRLFLYKEDFHFIWDLCETNSQGASFAKNPQYSVSVQDGGTVWFLLSRHFRSSIHEDNKMDVEANSLDDGFVSLYAFRSKGSRIYLADDALIRGPYVDSPNTLLKLELLANTTYTIVVSEQGLSRAKHKFTLSAFSRKRLHVSEVREKYSTWISRQGVWNRSTAGGNTSSPSYGLNPQFSLALSQTSDILLLLELTSGDIPVHVKLIWSDGKLVSSVTTRDVLGDSGEYRKGHAMAEILGVPAGRYTIICSTFERGQIGNFTLQIGSMSQTIVARLQVRQAGRFVTHIPTGFFEAGNDRLWASLRCDRLTRVSLIARTRSNSDDGRTGKGITMPLKLALEWGQGPMKQILAVSADDEFCNGQQGVQVNDVDIQPRMCENGGIWIVLERFGHSDLQSKEAVDVEVLSEGPSDIGAWVQGEGSIN
ncbi:MAG: hypothetical protein Q9214_004310 [Letrouitia sp. 1 TL-2023]